VVIPLQSAFSSGPGRTARTPPRAASIPWATSPGRSSVGAAAPSTTIGIFQEKREMKTTKLCAVLLVGVFLAAPVSAEDLWIGDPAPPLEITKWIGGEAVDLAAAKEKTVVVLDFWATWCGPCIASMPHVTELQKKYADNVVVIGVTRPDDNNSLETVEKFVGDNQQTMGYRTAFDGDEKAWNAYMKAAGQNGIPTVFIIDKTSTVAWIGHPMNMDKPLADVIAGTHDIKLVKVIKSLEQRAGEMRGKGDLEGVERAYTAIAALQPDEPGPWSSLAYLYAYELQWPGKTREAATHAVRLGFDNAGFLGNFAGFLAGRDKEYRCQALALKAANRAIELAPDDVSGHAALVSALSVNERDDEAKAHAAAAIERFADDAKALSRLSGTLAQRDGDGYRELALKAAEAAYKTDPTAPAETLQLIRLLATSEKTTEALAYARRALDTFRDDPKTLGRLASTLALPALEGRCGEMAMQAINVALAAEPDEVAHIQTKFRIQALCQKDLEQAKATGRYAIEKAAENPGFLNNFAWSLLTEEGLKGSFNDLALEAAVRCDQQTNGENWMYLDTLALAKFESGAKTVGIELQTKAINLAKDKGVAGTSLKEMEDRLAQFNGKTGG
jgi:thiol-disulfide isomerase/thioredoxin